MPAVIKLTFPAGRYHATPWGRHVNEGVPEWPPSPWRLMRALVAVWRRTCPELTEQQVRRVLEQLVHPPVFQLPAHRVAHTRHYMPWEKKGPNDRTLVFDTFVSVCRGDPLMVGWPHVELRGEDRSTLATLLHNLTSLGRAESWIDAELCDASAEWNCAPTDDDPNPVPVHCPDPSKVFADDHYPVLDQKKLAKGKLNPSEFLFDCPRWHLCLDTETIHSHRWPTVPGAKWVNYTRPKEQNYARISQKSKASRHPKPTVARFLLDGPVLPLLTDTVRIAEAFRSAAMSQFRRWCERHPPKAESFRRTDRSQEFSSPTISGRNLDGEIRRGHGHAHYLPTAEGADRRRITHMTLFASEGLDDAVVSALYGLRELRFGEQRSLRVQLIGLGRPADFTAPVLAEGRTWLSQTPLVAHRHFKKRQDSALLEGPDTPESFIALTVRELTQKLGIASPEFVEVIDAISGLPPARDFRRNRSKFNDDGRTRAFGYLKLRFQQVIRGPLCLGYASHFGLGLFLPSE